MPEKLNLQKLRIKSVLIILLVNREFIWRDNNGKIILRTGAGKVIEVEFQCEVVISGERQLVPFAQQLSCLFCLDNKVLSRELWSAGNWSSKELS